MGKSDELRGHVTSDIYSDRGTGNRNGSADGNGIRNGNSTVSNESNYSAPRRSARLRCSSNASAVTQQKQDRQESIVSDSSTVFSAANRDIIENESSSQDFYPRSSARTHPHDKKDKLNITPLGCAVQVRVAIPTMSSIGTCASNSTINNIATVPMRKLTSQSQKIPFSLNTSTKNPNSCTVSANAVNDKASMPRHKHDKVSVIADSTVASASRAAKHRHAGKRNVLAKKGSSHSMLSCTSTAKRGSKRLHAHAHESSSSDQAQVIDLGLNDLLIHKKASQSSKRHKVSQLTQAQILLDHQIDANQLITPSPASASYSFRDTTFPSSKSARTTNNPSISASAVATETVITSSQITMSQDEDTRSHPCLQEITLASNEPDWEECLDDFNDGIAVGGDDAGSTLSDAPTSTPRNAQVQGNKDDGMVIMTRSKTTSLRSATVTSTTSNCSDKNANSHRLKVNDDDNSGWNDNINDKHKRKLSSFQSNETVELDEVSKIMINNPFLHFSMERQYLSHLYISSYGSDYYNHLLIKEDKDRSLYATFCPKGEEAIVNDCQDNNDEEEVPSTPPQPATNMARVRMCRMRTRSFAKEHGWLKDVEDDEENDHANGSHDDSSSVTASCASDSSDLSSKSLSLSQTRIAKQETGDGERNGLSLPKYMVKQVHLEIGMRSILIDWLVGVASEFKLSNLTLHLAVALIDKALEVLVVEKKDFQCLGCACLLIASKLEECSPPTAADIAFFTDSACNMRDITKFELKVSITLNFQLQLTTAFHFADRFIKASYVSAGYAKESILLHPNIIFEAMVLFVLDLSLFNYELVEKKSSLIAAAAVYLARATVGMRDSSGKVWNESMEHYTGYSIGDLVDTIYLLHDIQSRGEENPHGGVYKKYKHRDFHEVATRASVLRDDLGLASFQKDFNTAP